MAHLNDGTLRRIVDDPDAITAPDREHYATCAECRTRFDAMAEDARATSNLLAAVPTADFDAAAAYQRLQTRDITRPDSDSGCRS